MKKIKIIALATMLIVFTGAMVMINSCTKNHIDENIQKSLIDEGSQAMTSHILAFKAKMEYYRQNPNIKTGGELYTADSAVLELESLLNFNFCYTGIECNQKAFVTSEVTMPLDELEKINDPGLMQVYYDKVIDTIQAQMGRINYTNMKLLLVDLEVTGTDSNGDAIVSVGALIGNERTVPIAPPPTGWWFGNLGGTCEHVYINVYDATVILWNDLMFVHFPAPPPGKIRRMTTILTLAPIYPWNHFLVPLNQRDNYMDSKLFFADKDYGTITDATRCLTDHDEMPFYRNHYNQFILDAEIDEGLELTELFIDDYEEYEGNVHSIIWHELTIYLGEVWLVDIGWVIEDIMTYEG